MIHLGDANATVLRWRQVMNVRYGGLYTRLHGPLPTDTNVYGPRAVLWQKEYETRTHQTPDGVVSDADLAALGIAAHNLPLFFSVEGHQSDMFHGPVADTANQLEAEELCHHLPTGYNDGAVPFDNNSGVIELARRLSQTTQDNGVPSPPGTKFIIGGFSQGMIVVYDFMERYFQPGGALAFRAPDCLGYLFYGNPCRAANSCAPWALAEASNSDGSHGLDPVKRFGLPGCVPQPANAMDVWRRGDIFAQNSDDLKGQLKAAVYQAVARGDFVSITGNSKVDIGYYVMAQFSQITSANYVELLSFVISVATACIDGVVFLADQPNPHYSPYDTSGGIAWARGLLQPVAAAGA